MEGTKDSQDDLGSTFPPSTVREISRKRHFPIDCFPLDMPPCHSSELGGMVEGVPQEARQYPKLVVWQLTVFHLDSSKPMYGAGKCQSGLWLPLCHIGAV